MSLTLRLALTYLLATLAGMLLLGAGFSALAERYLAGERERELAAQAELYAALLGELAGNPDALPALAAARPGAELLPAGTATRVFSSGGALLAGDPALGPFPSRSALSLLRLPLPLPASQVEGRRYAARPIPGGADTIGVVELSRDEADDTRLLATLRLLTFQAALGAAVVMAVLSRFIARSLARPILALTERAQQLAATYTQAEPAQAASGTAQRARRPRGLGGSNELVALEQSLAQLDGGLRRNVARIDELEQARARFYRSVSHELRTPLTAIRGALENLADSVPPKQRPALLSLEGEAERLGRLVDDLLRPPDDGRLALAERRPVDLAALAAATVALLTGRARRAGVTLEHSGVAPSVLGDRDRLKQALINLLDNALRATPPGGTVRVHVSRAAGAALVTVEDNGPGVPAELRERIWERGVRGAPDTAGSAGLGLAIVREIVVAHGGRAYLEEAREGGARFVLELPLDAQR